MYFLELCFTGHAKGMRGFVRFGHFAVLAGVPKRAWLKNEESKGEVTTCYDSPKRRRAYDFLRWDRKRLRQSTSCYDLAGLLYHVKHG